MKAKIVKIGNSRGIRLPAAILRDWESGDEVVLEASRGCIVVRPVSRARAGWEEAFKIMAKKGDDQLLDVAPVASTWDREEWEWR